MQDPDSLADALTLEETNSVADTLTLEESLEDSNSLADTLTLEDSLEETNWLADKRTIQESIEETIKLADTQPETNPQSDALPFFNPKSTPDDFAHSLPNCHTSLQAESRGEIHSSEHFPSRDDK